MFLPTGCFVREIICSSCSQEDPTRRQPHFLPSDKEAVKHPAPLNSRRSAFKPSRDRSPLAWLQVHFTSDLSFDSFLQPQLILKPNARFGRNFEELCVGRPLPGDSSLSAKRQPPQSSFKSDFHTQTGFEHCLWVVWKS